MDKIGEYQFFVEVLSWILLKHPFPEGELRDVHGGLLNPLERALRQYRDTYSLYLFPVNAFGSADHANAHFQHQLLLDSAFVRGEGLWEDIEDFAKAIYRPHSDWMIRKFGFTIDDAFQMQRAILGITEERFDARRKASIQAEKDARFEYERLLAENPSNLAGSSLDLRADIEKLGIDEAVERYCLWAFFGNSKHTLGITAEHLVKPLDGKVGATSVVNFLRCMSCRLGDVTTDLDPTAVHPLVIHPLIEYAGVYYLPSPSLLCEALLNRLYYDLIRDPTYKDTFDRMRSDWLEETAVETFRLLLPNAQADWGLKYGPGNTYEIDGLIRYDNKLLLVEAKWKTLTVAARQGDVLRAAEDMEKAVVEPYRQARRAREFILQQDEAVFTRRNGGTLAIRRSEIQHYVLVTILGKGSAVASLAVNLPQLKHFGFFADDDYPWAIPLMDLSVLAELLEFPSQLFDYLRRRDIAIRDGRFHFHDEWDILGHYFHGYLDPKHPMFEGVGRIFMAGMDTDIDHYKRSRADHRLPVASKPKRDIPRGIVEIIRMVESMDSLGRTDWTVALLSVPDEILKEIDQAILTTTERTHVDGQLHAVNLSIGSRDFGFTFVSAYNYERNLPEDMAMQCAVAQERANVREWLGLAVDTKCSGNWFSICYNDSRPVTPRSL